MSLIPVDELDLTPATVAAFLGASGWTVQSSNDAREVWTLSEGLSTVARLLLPVDPTFVDYDVRMHEALVRLCKFTGWDLQDLTTNIQSIRSDILYIRADQYTQDGTIPLRQARELIDGAYSLLESAARAALDPRPRYQGRKPVAVTNFVEDDIRMGHTQRGSFVITVMTRLDEAEEIPLTPDEQATATNGVDVQDDSLELYESVRIPPFQRQVMTTLASALEETADLAATADFGNLDRAISLGVSANLCNSLSQMTQFDGLRALDLSFRWSPREPDHPELESPVSLNRDRIPRLDQISERLTRAPEPVNASIFGQVTRLERGEEDDEGIVTVAGYLGRSQRRSVRLYLSGNDYDYAIRAHRSRTPVTVAGTLERRGASYWMANPVVDHSSLPTSAGDAST